MLIPMLLLILGVVLLGSLVAILLWRRFYRDDQQNTARRLLKNSTVPFITRFVVLGLEFVFLMVLYSMLPAAEIGPYTLAALLVAQYLGTFTEFGLGILLTREVAREPHNGPRLFGATLALRLVLVLVAVPVAASFIGNYQLLAQLQMGEAISPVGQQVIWILLLTLIPAAYSGSVTALFHAAEQMEVPAMIEMMTAVISMMVRIGLLLLGFGIVGLAWSAVAVSTCTALMYFVLQLRRFFRPSLCWNSALIWSLLPIALPLMLNNLLNMVFFRFDTFLIKAYGGGQGDLLLQQYAMPYQILRIALIVPPVITFALFPMLSRRAAGERSALVQTQNQTLKVMLLLAFPIAMGICILAPDLVSFFARRHAADYLPISAEVLALLAWFLPLSFVNGLLQYVLIAINQQHAITRAFLIGAFVNLTLNILFIPLFGLYAASVITILSEVVLLAVFWPLLRREGLQPPLLHLSWRPALASAIMGLAMVLLPSPGWFITALVALPVYGIALWWLGAFGSEERLLLRQILGRHTS
ncbi:MAG: flippase [Chloroflexaceae bacterium]|nr:flippase [Chloroflexaceae bacterium]